MSYNISNHEIEEIKGFINRGKRAWRLLGTAAFVIVVILSQEILVGSVVINSATNVLVIRIYASKVSSLEAILYK